MAAVITRKLKRFLIDNILSDFADSDNNRYYIGVGKSNIWNDQDVAPTPVGSQYEERKFIDNAQSIIRVSDASLVVPRYDWVSNATYNGYDDNFAGHPNTGYYVITDENNVYICLERGPDVSTFKPTGTTTQPFDNGDGYVWKFLYNIGSLNANKFLAANFLPVQFIDSDTANTEGATAAEILQYNIQKAAIHGQIVGYKVVTGGSGYTSTPTLTIVGDGSGAQAVATTDGSQITQVRVAETGGIYSHGSGYSKASITVGGPGTGAVIRAVIGPPGGIGRDPTLDLHSQAVMFNAKPQGAEGDGDWLIDQTFRQVGLIRNPLKGNQLVDSDFTDITGQVLKKLPITSATTDFIENEIIVSGPGSKAYIDDLVDSGGAGYLVVHQDDVLGYGTFSNGDVITGQTSGGIATVASAPIDVREVDGMTDPEVSLSLKWDSDSQQIIGGEILFIDNRVTAIERASGATEDIKVVVQF